MKTILFVLTALMTASAASASECYLILPNPNVPMCPNGGAEEQAYRAAVKAGLNQDVQKHLANMQASGATCKADQTKIIRTVVEAGNHGKDVSFLLLTEVVCKSNFFVGLPLHSFPITVKMWSSHEENDFSDIQARKLYDDSSL